MKRAFLRSFAGLMAAFCLVTLLHFPAHAASGKISFNDPTVTVGDTVTVTMKAQGADCALGALDATLTYDASLLEYQGSSSSGVTGGSGSISISWYDTTGTGVDSVSFSFTFKALATGSATIKPTVADVADIDYESVSLTSYGSSVVTINPVKTASSEARLSSLKVSPGSLSPSFDPDTTSYSVTVPAGTTKLTVSAKEKDSEASCSVSGTKLSVGTNTVTVTVTAEDGTTKKYTIKVTRPADPVEDEPDEPDEPDVPPVDDPTEEPLTVVVGGVTWYVDEAMNASSLPEGFSMDLITYQEREIAVAKSAAKGLTLLRLTDEAGEKGAFFIYDAATSSFQKYIELKGVAVSYTLLELPQDVAAPQGYQATSVAVGEDLVMAWIADQASELVLVYAMNGSGEAGFYRYDMVERTMQRYTGDTVISVDTPGDATSDSESMTDLEKENDALRKKLDKVTEQQEQDQQRLFILFCVAAAELVIFVVVIIILCTRKNGGEEERGGYQGSRSAGRRAEKREEE